MDYTKCLIACGTFKPNIFGNKDNVFIVDSIENHSKVHNKLLRSNTIVVYGGSFEAYELASSVRKAADKYGNFDAKIYLIEGGSSEPLRSFGEPIHKAIKSMMLVKGI